MKTPKLEEKPFIQALQSGSETAFRQLIETYQERVLNTCLGFVPRRQDAEDLAQEVFLEVFRSIEKFRGDAKLSTWIYQIAVRKSLEHIRYQNRQKRWTFVRGLVGLETPEAQAVPAKVDHPGVALENQERTTILFAKIDELSENQRTAFVLHKIEGLSHAEIAKIMGNSVSSVESLIFRARQHLQQKLEDYYKNEMI